MLANKAIFAMLGKYTSPPLFLLEQFSTSTEPLENKITKLQSDILISQSLEMHPSFSTGLQSLPTEIIRNISVVQGLFFVREVIVYFLPGVSEYHDISYTSADIPLNSIPSPIASSLVIFLNFLISQVAFFPPDHSLHSHPYLFFLFVLHCSLGQEEEARNLALRTLQFLQLALHAPDIIPNIRIVNPAFHLGNFFFKREMRPQGGEILSILNSFKERYVTANRAYQILKQMEEHGLPPSQPQQLPMSHPFLDSSMNLLLDTLSPSLLNFLDPSSSEEASPPNDPPVSDPSTSPSSDEIKNEFEDLNVGRSSSVVQSQSSQGFCSQSDQSLNFQ